LWGKGEFIMAKAIRFDYFKVYARSYDQDQNILREEICDLSDVMEQAHSIHITERAYVIGNDQARLQSVETINNKWEMHFVRIRKDGFPIKTHDDGTYGFFDDLADEEGFGEEASALYDPDNCVVMIRRNMHSLSPSAIAEYLTTLINEPGFTVIFKPLVHPRAIELLTQDHLIRSADVSVADIKHSSQTTKRSLGQIISGAEDINESVAMNFKISIEQKGSKKHSRLPIYEDLELLTNDPNVNKIEIRKKADEDSKTETVDLIRHRLFDYSTFGDADISPDSRNILHSTVVNRMKELYRTRVDDINNVYE
jgi:hypothetical protein